MNSAFHALARLGFAIHLALVGSAIIASGNCSSAYAGEPSIALPKGVQAGPFFGGIHEFRLPNGLTVLLYPDESKPRILVNVTYKVGSKHENYGETGMAHLLEHLLFKGSPGFENIDAEFSKRGMVNNGSTWLDRTNYFEVMPANTENLDYALGMEASRMTGAYIAKKDLDSEMTVVRNEMEIGETDPISVSLQALQAQAFIWHNYGNDTIGARADVENVPIERLQAFYRTYYQPDNAVLIVAGPIEIGKTMERINHYFAGIAKPTRTLPRFYTREPTQNGERESTIRRVAGTPLLLIGYHTPGAAHPDTVAMNVLLRVLGDDKTGRLREKLVSPGLASSAQAFGLNFQESSLASFALSFDKSHDVDKAKAEALRQIEALEPVTDAEFERAKRSYRNDLKSALDDVSRVGINLSEYIAAGDWRLFFLERQTLDSLTLAQVNAVAKRYFLRANRNSVKYLPEPEPQRAEIPPPPDLTAQLAQLKADESSQVSAGEQLDFAPLALEKRVERMELRPGLSLAMLSKKTRNATVSLVVNARLGDAESLKGKDLALEALGAMMNRGTTALDRVGFADALSAKEAEVQIAFSGQSLRVSARATEAGLIETLALIDQALKQPRLDASEFETWRKEQLTGLEAAENDPQARAVDALSRALNPYPPGHPLAQMSLEQQRSALQALKLSDLKAVHEQFVGAEQMQIAAVGQFDGAALKSALSAHFAQWRAKTPYQEIVELPYKKAPAKTWINTPDQANGFLYAAMPFALRDDQANYAIAQIADFILGSSGLDSRLMQRLREKDGVSYGGGSALGVSSESEASIWQIYALAAPENLSPSESAIKEELARFIKDGITQSELDSAKTGLVKAARLAQSNDARLASQLAGQQRLGRTMASVDTLEKQIQAASLAQVNAYIKSTLRLEQWAFVIAGDEKKASAKATTKP